MSCPKPHFTHSNTKSTYFCSQNKSVTDAYKKSDALINKARNIGLHLFSSEPLIYSFPKGLETFTVSGYNRSDTAIIMENKNNEKIFKYTPQIRYNNKYYVTISTELDGFRIFDHGEFSGKVTLEDVSQAAKIKVTTPGVNSDRLALHWPLWATEYNSPNVYKHDFEKNAGVEVPKTYKLVHEGNGQYGNWIVITGEMVNASAVHFELGDEDKTLLRAKFR